MNTRHKTYLTLLLSLLATLHSMAQTFTASGPHNVETGRQFRITYTINTQDVSDFRAGDVPDGLEVLMGPSTSRQSSFQIVNGHTSQSSSITFTFILVATKAGQYTIPAASITADGKTVSSNALHIKAEGDDADPSAQGGGSASQQQRQRRQTDEMRDAGSAISGSDLFITATASKQHVREQEPVLITYKVYTRVALTQMSGKLADMKGFHTQEIDLPQQKTFSVENIRGQQYKTVTWSQYVVFPQVAGKLQIPSVTFDGIVVQRDRTIDPFEAFFNGGSNYVEVKKKVVAPSLTLQVDPLPDPKPDGFAGGVGSFSISTSIDKQQVKAGDPVTLRVVVSGHGNMQLLREPTVEVPKDFERYDAKVTDKTKLTTRGLEGNIVYDFLIVPRHQGEYELPGLQYAYFDLATGKYKTLTTAPIQLKVEKGIDGNGQSRDFMGQEDVQELAKDIRYIKTGPARIMSEGPFFGSRTYMLAIGVLLLVFVVLIVVFRRRAIENADIVGRRAGQASKVASKRLKKARRLKDGNNTSDFYDEVLRALWGYVGDKLNMPVEQLSQEKISGQLQQHNVDEQTIKEFIGALEECEFERYAPGDSKGNMNKVYQKAVTAIEQIEQNMKRRQRRPSTPGTALIAISMLLTLPVASFAQPDMKTDSTAIAADAQAKKQQEQKQLPTKSDADSAYIHGRYQEAINMYELLLKQGKSAAIYYNLGNAYYRTDDITHAVLAYERALKMSPGDEDIRFNLQMAREKTIDKIVPRSEMFFVTWWHALVNMQSADGWAMMAIASLAMAVVLLLIYLFVQQIWLRKVGFFGGALAVILFLMANLLAWQQQRMALASPGAVITAPAATVKSTPAKGGTDLFILHEGSRVDIIDDTMREWKEIEVADGKRGWIERKDMERI